MSKKTTNFTYFLTIKDSDFKRIFLSHKIGHKLENTKQQKSNKSKVDFYKKFHKYFGYYFFLYKPQKIIASYLNNFTTVS